MSMTLVIGVAAVAFIVVMGLFFVLSRATGRSEGEIGNRMDQFVSRPVSSERAMQQAERSPSKLIQSIDQAVAEKSFARRIATNLARANLKLTVGEYLVLQVTSVLGIGLIFYLIMHRNPFLALGGLLLGYFLPGFYVKLRRGRRLSDFNNQLGDTINLLANGLRSGYSLLQAMDAVANEMPKPMSEEFQRVVREIGLGISTERAMNNMLRRIPSDDLDLMITAITRVYAQLAI